MLETMHVKVHGDLSGWCVRGGQFFHREVCGLCVCLGILATGELSLGAGESRVTGDVCTGGLGA